MIAVLQKAGEPIAVFTTRVRLLYMAGGCQVGKKPCQTGNHRPVCLAGLWEGLLGQRAYMGIHRTFSNTRWNKNFVGGAPVALRLRGELVRATASLVDDLALIGRVRQAR